MAMLAVGGSIGTGLLLGSGAAINIAGPAVVLSYVIGAAIVSLIAIRLLEETFHHSMDGPSVEMGEARSESAQLKSPDPAVT